MGPGHSRRDAPAVAGRPALTDNTDYDIMSDDGVRHADNDALVDADGAHTFDGTLGDARAFHELGDARTFYELGDARTFHELGDARTFNNAPAPT